ncbi:hypothetical protein DVK02_10925 [Halobellus sp. Atlit-31R]|nr:hypothetical protein DVK02_10925 [Halobellus sp. Atlit-31R]
MTQRSPHDRTGPQRRGRAVAALRSSLTLVLAAAVLLAAAQGVAATDRLVSGAPFSDTDGDAYDVVVENATDGVGAYNVTVSVGESSGARITGFDAHESAGLTDVTTAENGTRVVARVALMDTADSGRVTIGSVTLGGAAADAADPTLAVHALGDEDGDPYAPDTPVRVVSSSSNSDGGDAAAPSGGSGGGGVADSADDTVTPGQTDLTSSASTTVADGVDGTPADGEAPSSTDATDAVGATATPTDPETAAAVQETDEAPVTDSGPVSTTGLGVPAAIAAVGIVVLIRLRRG